MINWAIPICVQALTGETLSGLLVAMWNCFCIIILNLLVITNDSYVISYSVH